MLKTEHIIMSLILLGLCACAPFPHKETIAPAITGRVHRDGNPVKNAMVYFDFIRCNVESKFFSRTDGEGRFDFAIREQFNPFSVYLVGRWEGWGICIADGDTLYQGFHVAVFEVGNRKKAKRVTLDCNLGNMPYERKSPQLEIRGICTSLEYN